MRTTIDIPDEMYRELKIKAAREGTTIREILLEGLEMVTQGKQTLHRTRFEIPVIRSKRPGTLHLTNEQIDDLTAFS
jgi:hypothetical protein